jgi:hypothetical protein
MNSAHHDYFEFGFARKLSAISGTMRRGTSIAALMWRA